MSRDEEERPARKVRHEVGESLDSLSVEDLRARTGLLRQETLRLEAPRSP